MKPIALAALAGMAASTLSPPAMAQARGGDLETVERELIAKAAEESRLVNEAAARKREFDGLRRQLISSAEAIQTAERRIAEINTDIDRLEGEEKTLAAALRSEQQSLSDVLAALQSIERARPPALLVTPEDANKAARAAMLLADAAPTLEGKARALRQSLDELKAVQASLARERAAAQKENRELAARRGVLSDLMARKRAERDVADRLAAAAQRETAALAARASSLRDLLQRLERFARSISPRIKPAREEIGRPIAPTPSRKPSSPVRRFAPGAPFSAARGAVPAPVTGRMVGKFGDRRPEGGTFDGVRFITADRAIVTAPFDADVIFARPWNPISDLIVNLVVLDVGEGYHILLLGLGAFLVEAGQEVAAGEPIGSMTGDNARLDVEIRKGGEPVNPSLWITGKSDVEAAL